MKPLLIFPFSGTAKEALDCLGAEWHCVGLITDDQYLIGTTWQGIPILGREAFELHTEAFVLAVQGSPTSFRKREEITDKLQLPDERFATVIHPAAIVSRYAQLGRNVLVMAGVVITATAVVKDGVIILPNSVIHHDSIIGANSLIGANVTIAGNVTIGKNCYLGAASSVRNGEDLPAETLVGMGANITKTWDGQKLTLVGNPAKPIQPNSIAI